MAVRTYAQLATIISTTFADNTSGNISEADLREILTDLCDTLAFEADIVDVAAAIETFRLAAATLEQKEIKKRVVGHGSAPAIAINVALTDIAMIAELNINTTLVNPVGICPDGHTIGVWIKDLGVARTIGYGANFGALNIALPTTTTANKWMYLEFMFNQIANKYFLMQYNQQP